MAKLEIGSNYGRGISSIVRERVTPVGKREKWINFWPIFGSCVKSRSQSVRKGIVLLLVNLRWTQLSENFLLILKIHQPSVRSVSQPTKLFTNFPFKLEICYEERLEILQEEICNFEESFLLLEPSQTLRYFLQRYEKNFSNILNLVLFQTLRILENRNTCSKNPTEKIPSEKSDALTSRFVETPIFAVEKSAGI